MAGPAPRRSVLTGPGPRYFTIDPSRPFLADLAQGLRAADAMPDPAALHDAVIYLPTRRAVRALAGAFVDTAPDGAAASLLPRLRALGDIDEDALAAFPGAATDELALPPAISQVERRLTLARLVAARQRKTAASREARWAAALSAADELAKLLDSFHTEELAPTALESLAPDHLAEHWRQSLAFLSIITQHWPEYLAERGLMDPAHRRVKMIDRQAAAWRKAPPAHPVIIAGTTGSAPVVARLIKTAAALPQGAVVLPGLDLAMPDAAWARIDEAHPQSGLKQLLNELEISRQAVRPWPAASIAKARAARRDIIAVALCPADASDSWRDWALAIKDQKATLAAALENFTLVEARDEDTEAAAIALKIRETVEIPDKTVFLVTPDRHLTRRVASKLRRWALQIDDSAGVPFANTPCGTYLRLIAEWLNDPCDAVAAMSVLRHALFGGGLSDQARWRAVNSADRDLRGLKPATLEHFLIKIKGREDADTARGALAQLLAEADARWRAAPDSLAGRLTAHLVIAEALAATPDAAGADRLWRGDDGEAGAVGLAQLRADARAALPATTTEKTPDAIAASMIGGANEYAGVFNQLIADMTVRRSAPGHPRIAILGPLEARLQQADVVILGGLNEGVWPRDAAVDPFLSRGMRRALGLPSPEQRIGLAAHDFAQFAAAPEVMATRAVRAGGKPSKPSRWIVRLKNILKGADALSLIDQTQIYEGLAQMIDAPVQPARCAAPTPRPPLSARPKDFYVTHVETLLRDPYAIYAKKILRLRKLDALNEPFGPRQAGELFHALFAAYARQSPPPTRQAQLDRLEELAAELAPACGMTPAHAPFWATRMAAMFSWFAEWDAAQREKGAPAVIEESGVWRFALEGETFTLSAKADRIDALQEGGAYIIDYKTGAPPTLNQTQTFSPQLPLTANIVEAGGFDALGARRASGFAYIRLTGRKEDGKDDVAAHGDDAEKFVTQARDGFMSLLRHFLDPQTPYLSQPRPQYQNTYGDYDHLARRRERNAHSGGPASMEDEG